MNRTVLVCTTVHHPDDTRIRERLIRSLAGSMSVSYASPAPGPTDPAGVEVVSLPGGRLRRWAGAAGVLLAGRWDVAVVHDPELIPVASLARVVRGRPVVFDVHEDLPRQVLTKSWIPPPLRGPAALFAKGLYALAESSLVLTLAERRYRRLFRGDHPTFPNHPRYEAWPDPVPGGDGSAVYVGDVTPQRGLATAVRACAAAGVPLVVIGQARGGFGADLIRLADDLGCDLTLTGRMPNLAALERVSLASVGLSPLLDAPNYRHSLPTKTIEYLAAGIPVVASDLPGTREVLGSLDAVWLVPPGDHEALAAALGQAMGARADASAQATVVRDRFSWPEEEVRSFYGQLVDP